MAAMGITGDAIARLQRNLPEEGLRASAHYVPSDARIPLPESAPEGASAGYRQPSVMRRAGASSVLTPGQAPPDLPSLLLDSRIVYIGMPLVASVTEVIISELLWLNYHQPDKPVYMYLNTLGSQKDFQAIGFDTEAYAILDTMNYIRPHVATLVIGQAYGNACMLLAAGQPGKRAALEHARIKMAPPRINRAFGPTTDIMIRANELEDNTSLYVNYLAKFTKRDPDAVAEACARDRYFTPAKAIEYGLIDRIVRPKEGVAIDRKDYEGALAASQRSSRERSAPAAGPQAGSA